MVAVEKRFSDTVVTVDTVETVDTVVTVRY